MFIDDLIGPALITIVNVLTCMSLWAAAVVLMHYKHAQTKGQFNPPGSN
jgi:hypothetical protein